MGCSPSKVLAGPSAHSQFTELDDVAAAEKLDWLLGVAVRADDATKKGMLVSLDTWFRSRVCDRGISKKVDLAHCLKATGEYGGTPTLDAGLTKELANAVKEKKALASLTEALDTLHERWQPKQCLGFAGLYHKVGAANQPIRYAFEHGCRMFDLADPPTPEIQALFESIGMADEFMYPDSVFEEFKGKDTSELCLAGGPMLIVQMGQEHTLGPHTVRESFERARKKMAPFEAEFGLPLIDVYMLMPMTAWSFPDFRCHGCFSDMWKEAEKLVDEGLVRSLGINNATIHQIEATLEFARHRPVMATFEQHILNQQPDMVAFLKEHKMAARSHIALGKGDVLESECLKRTDMTPAQAGLKWHVQQGVTPCFGNDSLEHIAENMHVQTEAFMALPDVVAPKPARHLMKLYPMTEMNCPGMCCMHGDRDDEGILRKDNEGRYWCASTRAAGDKWSKVMSDGQELLIREIEQALSGIKRDMKAGHARRQAISNGMAGLIGSQEGGVDVNKAIEKAGELIAETMEKAKEKGTDTDDEMVENMSAFHSITADAGAKGLVECVVVPLSTFREKGQIPRRSKNNSTHSHVPVTALGADDKVLFFSQRWLTPSPRALASPDDAPGGTKYKQLMAACKAYMTKTSTPEANVYIWLDYSSVDQDSDELLVKGVNSLALYVCSADAFISIDHADYFDRGWCLMECMFADCSKTPRYIFTKENVLKELLPDMRLESKKPTEGNFTVESDRAIMIVLSHVANTITGMIDRGANFSVSKALTGKGDDEAKDEAPETPGSLAKAHTTLNMMQDGEEAAVAE